MASLADAIRSGYAGRVAPLLDHAFASAMRDVAQGGGRELVASFGGRDLVGMLIEFRTALAWPGRRITVRQAEAVLRYRDLDECRAAIRHSAGAGFLELDDGFRAAARGMEFLTELYALHGRVTAARWAGQEPRVCRTAEVLGRVLTAAEHTGGDAWRAMAPPYEAGAGTGAVLLNRMGTLRYHRADAHAAAWQGAGLTAAGIVGLTGSPRDAIEAQTNRLAGPPFAVLTAAERATLLADLSALAG
ncbi:MAG: hypothetical protein AUI14_11635 [Actinobacteria bacterium 13_2_20CM_2_71_6]|nr:MAG: hypothetical protein AUI14_11635 [Actinobacteria bacterium 13_2_20CM_2_71_6]